MKKILNILVLLLITMPIAINTMFRANSLTPLIIDLTQATSTESPSTPTGALNITEEASIKEFCEKIIELKALKYNGNTEAFLELKKYLTCLLAQQEMMHNQELKHELSKINV